MIVNPDEYTGTIYYVARDEGRVSGIPVSPFFSLPFEAKLWLSLWGDSEQNAVRLQRFR